MIIKANKIGYTKEGKFCFLADNHDVLFMKAELDKHKPTTILTVEIKKFVPKRTKKQLGIFWKAWDYYCKKVGILDASSRHFLYEGFKQQYAMKKDSGMLDPQGNPILVPIGLSEANRLDEFAALFQGLFDLMDQEGVDYAKFLRDWEEYKREQEKQIARKKQV